MSEEPKVVELRANSDNQGRVYEERDGFAAHIVRLAGAMASAFPGDLHGVVIVGVSDKGHWSVGYRVREGGPIGVTMLAGLALAAITKDMLAAPAAGEALIRNGLMSPPPEDSA